MERYHSDQPWGTPTSGTAANRESLCQLPSGCRGKKVPPSSLSGPVGGWSNDYLDIKQAHRKKNRFNFVRSGAHGKYETRRSHQSKGFAGGSAGIHRQESTCWCRRRGFNPWSGRIPHAEEQLSPGAAEQLGHRAWSPGAIVTEPTRLGGWSRGTPEPVLATGEVTAVRSPLTTARGKPAQWWRPSRAEHKQVNTIMFLKGKWLRQAAFLPFKQRDNTSWRINKTEGSGRGMVKWWKRNGTCWHSLSALNSLSLVIRMSLSGPLTRCLHLSRLILSPELPTGPTEASVMTTS